MFQQADLTETIQRIPWFSALNAEQIERLANMGKLIQIDCGQRLYDEGARQDFLYIILSGQIVMDIHVPAYGLLHAFTAEPLDVVGWDPLAPVIRQRLSDAVATQPTLLLAFPGDALHEMCDDDHEFGFTVYRRMTNVVSTRLLNILLVTSNALARLSSQS